MSRDRTTKPGHDGSGGRGAEAHGDVDPLQQARSAVQLAEGLGPMPGVVVAAQQAIADRSYSAALAATRAWMMHKPHVELLARSMDPSDQDVPRAQALLDRMRPIEPKLPRNIFKLGIAELDREDEAEWLALVGAPPKRQDKSSAYAGAHGNLEGNAGLDDGASVHVGHTSDPILDLSPGDIAKGVLVPPWALVKPVRQRVLGADHDPVMGGVDDVLDGLINDTDYLSGFVVGAVQGTQAAIRDCQNAPVDLIKLIISELKKFALDKHYDVLVRLRDMIKQAPAAIELLGKRWNDDSDRHAQGAFQGEVVGYIGTQLAILIVTSFAGPLAEAFGPYAGVIRAIAAVGDPVSVVREVALGVRLSKDAEMALQAARNAQRAEAAAADAVQGAAKVERGAAKVEQGAVRAEQAAGQALDLADDGSRAGAGLRAGVAAEHDASAAVPLMQDAVKPLSRAESLLEGLPGDLRGRTRIIESPVLTDSTVQVAYRDGIELVVGAGATPRHVAYHAHTVRMLLRYEGLTGKLRRLIDKALTLLRVRAGYGTAGFEAELEVQKLTAIRDDLQRLLAKTDGTLHSGEAIDPAILRAELESVEAQLVQHEQALGSFERGRGVVAAEGPEAPDVPTSEPAAAATPRDALDQHNGQRQAASAEQDAPISANERAATIVKAGGGRADAVPGSTAAADPTVAPKTNTAESDSALVVGEAVAGSTLPTGILSAADVDTVAARIRATGRLVGDMDLWENTLRKAKANIGDHGAIGEIEAVARWIDEGRLVEVLPERQNAGVTNPDYRVDGRLREVKTRSRALGKRWIKDEIADANTQFADSGLIDAGTGLPETGTAELQLRGEVEDASLEGVERQVRGAMTGRNRSVERVRVLHNNHLLGEWARLPDGSIQRVFPST